jgi:hypothetical protein
MRPTLAPLHLLFFDHPFANHLVHGRFHKPSADALAVAIALAIVLNKIRIVVGVRVKLRDGFQEFPCRAVVTGRDGYFKVALHRLDDLEGLGDIAVPEEPFQPFERPDDWGTRLIRALFILRSLGEAFGPALSTSARLL